MESADVTGWFIGQQERLLKNEESSYTPWTVRRTILSDMKEFKVMSDAGCAIAGESLNRPRCGAEVKKECAADQRTLCLRSRL
ncbi:MAG: hypothetical protein R6W92_08195 [Desulfocurvibacter africanus]